MKIQGLQQVTTAKCSTPPLSSQFCAHFPRKVRGWRETQAFKQGSRGEAMGTAKGKP